MKSLAASALALLLLAGPFEVRSGEPKIRRPDLFLKVWRPFRTAVADDNPDAAKSLTRFPLAVDTDGTLIKLSAKQFSAQWNDLLESASSVKPKQTMRVYIAEKEELTEDDLKALRSGEIRMGVFIFRRFGERWLWAGVERQGTVPAAVAKKPTRNVPPEDPVAIETPVAVTEDPVAVPEPPENPSPSVSETPVPAAKPPPPPVPKPKAVAPPVHPTTPAPAKQEPATPVAAPDSAEGIRGYWRTFRDAVLGNDRPTVKSLTKFPFETRGTMDSQKTKRHDAREFDLLYTRLLQADPRTGPMRDSMRELIWRKQDLTVDELATAESLGEIHIGVFVFQRKKNRWLFTRANVDD